MLKNAITIALVLAGCSCPASEPLPGNTYLLLHNGQTIRGSVQVQADCFLVNIRSGIQMRLARDAVVFRGESLAEIYAYQRASVNPRDILAILRLADWCLREGLLEEAGFQIARARQIRNRDPRIAHLQRRLTIQQRPPIDAPGAARSTAPPVVSSDQVQKRIGRLSAETIQQFTSLIQPLMLNRCGTNQCHGPTAGSSLTLIRTAAGRPIPQRLTYRNLYNILGHLGQGEARESSLLLAPAAPHGKIDGGIFTEQERIHVENLIAWCERATQPTSSPLPETIAGPETILAQPAPAISPVTPAVSRTGESAGHPPAPPRVPRSGGSDPFDPGPFNERFHRHRLPALLPSSKR
jgi:hypothetical protein